MYRIQYVPYDFNPHPHVEGDGNGTYEHLQDTNFNPHPHVEGDNRP